MHWSISFFESFDYDTLPETKMAVPVFPANSKLLYSTHLNPDTFTLVGAVPNQYPHGISVYIANDDPYSTVMTQVIVSRHQTANAANLFNKTVYIPARNMANFTNMSNIAGLNVFAKTSGTYTTVYVVYNPKSNDGNQIIDVTPNVVNQDQTITPMPAPQQSNSNSIGSQLLYLNGQITTLTGQLSALTNSYNTLQTQVNYLQSQIAVLKDS